MKQKLNLVPVAYRITGEQKKKVKLLADVAKDSESGIIRKLITSRKLPIKSLSTESAIKMTKN